jgi:hypothetical protein
MQLVTYVRNLYSQGVSHLVYYLLFRGLWLLSSAQLTVVFGSLVG